MGKPCCLQHNHFIVVIYLEAPWAGLDPRFAHCHAARDEPLCGGGPYGPGCRGQGGMEMQRKANLTAWGQWEIGEDRASCLVLVGQQGRSGKAEAGAGMVRGWCVGKGRAVLWDARAGYAHIPVVLWGTVPMVETRPSQGLCGWGSEEGLGRLWGNSRGGSGGAEHFGGCCGDVALWLQAGTSS